METYTILYSSNGKTWREAADGKGSVKQALASLYHIQTAEYYQIKGIVYKLNRQTGRYYKVP